MGTAIFEVSPTVMGNTLEENLNRKCFCCEMTLCSQDTQKAIHEILDSFSKGESISFNALRELDFLISSYAVQSSYLLLRS